MNTPKESLFNLPDNTLIAIRQLNQIKKGTQTQLDNLDMIYLKKPLLESYK